MVLMLLSSACTVIKPAQVKPDLPPQAEAFSHDEFNRVLNNYVDNRGFVDYSALKRNPQDLERYYELLVGFSPDSHPHLFPSQHSKLAYWINAYNASVIKTVLVYYPIQSVEDVKPPWLLFFMPTKSGFFLFQRIILGGHGVSLYGLENFVIRERFQEPRIHFAINCASISCAPLLKEAFRADRLDSQLEQVTISFMGEERNVRIDHENKAVYLSAIFKWYREDYLDWYQAKFPGRKANLLSYVRLYLSPAKQVELDRAKSYEIRFLPYDWGLNDSKAGN